MWVKGPGILILVRELGEMKEESGSENTTMKRKEIVGYRRPNQSSMEGSSDILAKAAVLRTVPREHMSWRNAPGIELNNLHNDHTTERSESCNLKASHRTMDGA